MNDPNKKGQGQVAKRNPEEDVTHLFLEASLNIGVFNLSIPENQQVKNKPIDGPRNKVFLTKSAPYKFYLGNFSLDKLEKVLEHKEHKLDYIYELYGKGLFNFDSISYCCSCRICVPLYLQDPAPVGQP